MRIIRTLTIALLLFCTTAAAQPPAEPLFIDLAAGAAEARSTPATARREVIGRRHVGMRLDRLFGAGGGQAIELNLGERVVTASFERVDVDDAGFRSWVGTIDGIDYSHVVFTERQGVVSGLVDGVSFVYQVITIRPGLYALELVDRGALREGADAAVPPRAPPDESPASAAAAPDDASSIDVLILYTPAARDARGGTEGIRAAAAQTISDSNTAFARSAIATRFRLVGTRELPYVEASRLQQDLDAVTYSPLARGWRNEYSADVVQLLVNSPDLTACGFGWILPTVNTPIFDAYSVADVACFAQYTPTHELGHNLGADHAPEDGGSRGVFSYAYAYKDPARGFRTVMAYACGSTPCPRILNFSNPSISHNGGPTGTTAQNNALALNNTAATIANLRQSSPPSVPPPAAPVGLTSEVNGLHVRLAWSPGSASPVTSYTLQVGSTWGRSDVFNAALGNVTTVAGMVGPGVYYWRVLAANAAGTGPPSAEAQFTVGAGCAAPGAPQAFSVSIAGRTVTLTWTPPANGSALTNYVIEAGTGPGLADLLNASNGSTQTRLTTPAPPGTYYVRIRAQNACGIGPPSNEQRIVVP